MAKTKNLVVGVVGLLASCLVVVAQTNLPSGGLGSFFSLEQFGPIGTPAEAEKTFQKAAADIVAAGGGVILIPPQAPPSWKPKNNIQRAWRKPEAPEQTKSWGIGPQVTVIDGRGRTLRFLTSQIKGLELERTLDLPTGDSLPHWDYHPMLTIKNTTLRGSGSYHDWLQQEVKAGKDQRFYVATIRGIFPGMFLNALVWGAETPRLCIKSLGYDAEKKMWYFVADTDVDVQKGAIMSNKHHTNLLSLESASHTENQTFDVRMWRHKYSQGDTYLFDARFKYMSDVHSTAGDENGVLYAAFIEPLLNIFRGQVEKWDPASSELVFKSGASGATLGSGRPIINLNPAKWVTNGTVMIVQPASWTDYTSVLENPVYKGKSYPTTLMTNKIGVTVLRMGGLIRFAADAPVTDDVVGHYFAVDDPSEYVAGGHFGGSNIRRWYLIDSVTKNADGTKDMTIVRHWWGAKSAGAPMLYKKSNSTWDGHERPLRYVIAPGVNVYDVSLAVSDPKRTLKLSPFPFAGTKFDFAPSDPIEQAIGPDPFKPISFRTWMWDAVPGAFPAPVFDVANNGQVMREYLMHVRGGHGNLEKDIATKHDQNPVWDKFIGFDSTCNIGLQFGADTANAAILFTQPNNRVQPIKWYYGTDATKLPKEASLTVSRDTGDFNFSGGLVTKAGLSGGDKPARNLRGLNVAVKAGANEHTVTFPVLEADDQYGVFIEQSWIGQRAIVKKDANGFTVQFEKPAGAGAKFDWLIVR